MKRTFIWMHRRLKISTKIFFITFILIVALILLLNFFFQRNAARTLLYSQTEFAKQLVEKSDEYLQLNLNNIKSFFLSIVNDTRLQSGDYEEVQSWLNDNLIYYIPNAKNIHLLKDNQVVASTTTLSWMIENEREFVSAMEGTGPDKQIYWSKPYYSPVSGYTVTTMMRVPARDGSTLTLALDLDFAGLYNSIIPSISSSLQGYLVLLDRQNHPLYGTQPYIDYNVYARKYEFVGIDQELFNKTWVTYNLKQPDRNLFFIRKQNTSWGWQEVWIMDQAELLRPLQGSISNGLFLAILSFVLALIISYTLSILIGGPIKKIAKSMDYVSNGQWNTTISTERYDELGLLARHFNQMTTKIRDLIADLKRTEKAKNELDFLALQSQIRPHFLYNTLNSISIAAREHQLDKVDVLISSLTETIQYSLDLSPAPVTLAAELDTLHSYINLMQIRYEGHFIVEMDIDPLTKDFILPKFTLQPLIENSIFHGLIPKNEIGTLFVGTTLQDDSWDIMIEDSGVGIAPERLAALLNSLSTQRISTKEHIGMYNVHRRLQFMFGERYRFQLTSNIHTGTRIILTLPAMSEPAMTQPAMIPPAERLN